MFPDAVSDTPGRTPVLVSSGHPVGGGFVSPASGSVGPPPPSGIGSTTPPPSSLGELAPRSTSERPPSVRPTPPASTGDRSLPVIAPSHPPNNVTAPATRTTNEG